MSYTTAAERGLLCERFDSPGSYAGYWVLDPEGRKVGKVKELFVNANDEPEYIRVRIGAGGLKTVLIPVQIVTIDEARHALVLQ